MFNINLYLGKFKKLTAGNQETRESIKQILQSVLKTPFSDSQIIVNGKTLSIKAEPALKSLIFMKKKDLLESLKNNPKTSSIDQIV